jgi:hypothetical protein
MHPQGVNPIAPPPLPLIEPCIYTTQLARSNCVAPFLHFCTRAAFITIHQVTARIKQTLSFYPVHAAVIAHHIGEKYLSPHFVMVLAAVYFTQLRIRDANDALHVELPKKVLFFANNRSIAKSHLSHLTKSG